MGTGTPSALKRLLCCWRSALVQRALGLLLAEKEKARRRRAYVEGYGRHPETPGEIEAAESASARLLAGEPWE